MKRIDVYVIPGECQLMINNISKDYNVFDMDLCFKFVLNYDQDVKNRISKYSNSYSKHTDKWLTTSIKSDHDVEVHFTLAMERVRKHFKTWLNNIDRKDKVFIKFTSYYLFPELFDNMKLKMILIENGVEVFETKHSNDIPVAYINPSSIKETTLF